MGFGRVCLLAGLLVAVSGCVDDRPEVLEPDPDVGPVPDATVDGSAEITGRAAIEPANVAFEGSGDQMDVVITNVGDGPLHIERVSRRGDAGFAILFGDRSALGLGRAELTGGGLPPGDAITLTVAALADPPAMAMISIQTSDPDSPEIEIPVGFPGVPCLQALPPTVDLGMVPLGETVQRQVDIHNCGDEPIALLEIALTEGTHPRFVLLDVPAFEPLGPGDVASVNLGYAARTDGVFQGALEVVAEGAALTVPLSARTLAPQCPVAVVTEEPIQAVPLDIVTLDGSASIDPDGLDNRPAQWEWVVLARPDGSVSQPHETYFDSARPADGGLDDDIETPNALFVVDIAGDYIVRLRVTDADGCVDEADVYIRACHCDNDGFSVQISWSLADGPDLGGLQRAGPDVDLHLLHPNADNWFNVPFDCYFRNPIPDWGQIDNPMDDPVLDIDGAGHGPETITLAFPEDTLDLEMPYLIGADYYAWLEHPEVGDQPLPVEVTARVFVRGEQVTEMSTELATPGHFWDAASIDWPSGDVTLRDRIYRERP